MQRNFELCRGDIIGITDGFLQVEGHDQEGFIVNEYLDFGEGDKTDERYTRTYHIDIKDLQKLVYYHTGRIYNFYWSDRELEEGVPF